MDGSALFYYNGRRRFMQAYSPFLVGKIMVRLDGGGADEYRNHCRR